MTADALFKILGNKIRLRLLCLLRERNLRVGDLQTITGLPMAVISKDLMRLRAKKLVAATRRGVFITYFLPGTPECKLLQAVLEQAKDLFPPEIAADEQMLKSYVPAKIPKTAAEEKSFSGNVVRSRGKRSQVHLGSDQVKEQNSKSHFGELPTSLL